MTGGVIRVDGLFLKAIEKRKEKLHEEDVRRFGVKKAWTTKDITAIFGYEYLRGDKTLPYEVAVSVKHISDNGGDV